MTTRARCNECGRLMSPGDGCTAKTILINGRRWNRIQVFAEDICHDCNAARGALHHPGCDMERCPACGGQLIGCDCGEQLI